MMNTIKKILILSANPKNRERLRLDEEVRDIREALRRSTYRDQFQIEPMPAVRSRDVRRIMLEFEPNIVHFCGHGEQNGLMIEDEQGNSTLIESDTLEKLFDLLKQHVECVLLNSCYSAIQAKAIHKHIKYVIGMPSGINDRAAIEFAVGFYDGLGAGRNFKDAYEFGKNAINGIPDEFIPILLERNNNTSSSKEKIQDDINVSSELLSTTAKSILAKIEEDTHDELKGLTIHLSSSGGFLLPYLWWNNERIDNLLYPYLPLAEIVKIKLAVQQMVEHNVITYYDGKISNIEFYILNNSIENIIETLSSSLLKEIRSDTHSKIKGLTIISHDAYNTEGIYLSFFYEKGVISCQDSTTNIIKIRLAAQHLEKQGLLKRYISKEQGITRYILMDSLRNQ